MKLLALLLNYPPERSTLEMRSVDTNSFPPLSNQGTQRTRRCDLTIACPYNLDTVLPLSFLPRILVAQLLPSRFRLAD
jgi:hypothetical protein